MCFDSPRIPKHQILSDNPYASGGPYRQKTLWKRRLWLGGLMLASLIIASIWLAEHSRADETTAQGSGQLLLTTTDGVNKSALILKTEAELTIQGMVIHTTFKQSFKNTSDTQWAEGVYVFPLPDTAAISKMRMQIGERVIEGIIKEKGAAKTQYEKAKATGKTVSLVTQQRPNLFTQKVANIGPGETVSITLAYTDTARYDQGVFSTRLPTTLTPRYVPGTVAPQAGHVDSPDDMPLQDTPSNYRAPEKTALLLSPQNSPWGWALPTDQVPDADQITPPQMPSGMLAQTHQLSLSVNLQAGLPLQSITSPYHDLVVEKHGAEHRIRTRQPTISMDRDFVLQWQPVSGQNPQAAVFIESQQAHDYAMVMLLPPQPSSSTTEFTTTLPRDSLFIIDTSGSMGGNSIQQAKKSLLLALDRLKPQDHFNVIEFNSRYRKLFSNSLVATEETVRRAKSFVRSLEAGGGTEMAAALQAALNTPEIGDDSVRQIVFITDGSVGNEAALFQLIHQQLHSARLFTVGIGSAPNTHFMRKAAHFGRGTFTHIGSTDEVAHKMNQLFNKLESPQLHNINVRWPDGLTVEQNPHRVPDLYQGEPLLIKARLDRLPATGIQLEITGQAHSHSSSLSPKQPPSSKQSPTWHQSLTLLPNTNHPQSGIAQLWARQQISDLLDEKALGANADAIRARVLPLALRHQLLSPYTSFIAEDTTPRRPTSTNNHSEQKQTQNLKTKTLHTQAVGNQTPVGQVPLNLPKTATTGPLHLLLGALCLLALAALSLPAFWRRGVQP